MSREEIYDRDIAPLMTKIISVCKENNIPLHAHFKLDDGDTCVTQIPDNSAQFRMFRYLSAAGDNFDAFVIAVARDAEKYGHTSAFLQALKVSALPPETT